MEPNSIVVMVVLLLAAAGMVIVLVRVRWRTAKAASAVVVVALSMLAGMAAVNDYFGYYQSWSQLAADATGSYRPFTSTPLSARHHVRTGDGRVVELTLAGGASHIDRPGLVYLPPQYFEHRYARTRFPVLELLHGTPGQAANWTDQLHVAAVADRLTDAHLAGPMILVMPTMSVGRDFQEGVNAPHALDDTYLTRDVRVDVVSRFRASRVPSEWGISGYSSGGYAAANLALRHRADFGATAVMDGYYRPQDGPAAAALHDDRAAENANDPLLNARRLTGDSAPLPSFWVSAGTGDPADVAAARAFVHALHGVEQVTFYREPGAGHNFYAWRAALPHVLAWAWTQLAPPSLRVQFPVAGSVHDLTIVGGQRPHRSVSLIHAAARSHARLRLPPRRG